MDVLAAALEEKRAAIGALPAVLSDTGCSWEQVDDIGRNAADAGLSLLAAITAVLELHRADHHKTPYCEGCELRWPCATVGAIRVALAGTGKEGSEDGEHA